MNFIKKFFVKRENKKLYYQYIEEHKRYILKAFYEMLNCKYLEWFIWDDVILKPLWYRVLDHDISKYEPYEFEPYRKHFFPIDLEEFTSSQQEYLKARENHIKNNDHHWEARVSWKDEDFDIKTELACLENVLDWLAKGYQFKKSYGRPYQYYEAHKDQINLPKKQKEFIEKIIYEGIDKDYIINQQKKEKVNNEII